MLTPKCGTFEAAAKFASAQSGVNILWFDLDHAAWRDMPVSFDEQTRASRFYLSRDRRRYRAAHAVLRQILGRVIDVDSQKIDFRVGPNGKPAIDNASPVEFNLTHSGRLGGIAVSRSGPVGLDCELTRDLDHLDLAYQVASAPERAILGNLPEQTRPAEFFRLWTRKEAALKATGFGITFPLRDVTVLEQGDTDNANVDIPGAGVWWVADLDAPKGWAAAVCAPSRCELRAVSLAVS